MDGDNKPIIIDDWGPNALVDHRDDYHLSFYNWLETIGFEDVEIYLHHYNRTTILPGLGIAMNRVVGQSGVAKPPTYDGYIGILPFQSIRPKM
jgi:hypothetical protein